MKTDIASVGLGRGAAGTSGSTRRSTARWTPVNPSAAETGAMPKMLRWTRRGALALAVVVLAGASAGVTYEAIASAQDAAGHPAPGRLVDVGGHRLHLACVGEGSPTVVFESGLANMSADWSTVQPQV